MQFQEASLKKAKAEQAAKKQEGSNLAKFSRMGKGHFRPGNSTCQGPEVGGMRPAHERNGKGQGAGHSGQAGAWITLQPRGATRGLSGKGVARSE